MDDWPKGRLLTPEEVSAILGVAVQTLARWRCNGSSDLKYVKVGKLVRYRPEDVKDYIGRRMA
ncbi:MAG: helix-turn-helix domain-containing protein [Candidatus Sericytochromatia bacterium]|nr:helix-turn-helix domain-containing protein [Candidatus Tanganyikabacteria bacterium]